MIKKAYMSGFYEVFPEDFIHKEIFDEFEGKKKRFRIIKVRKVCSYFFEKEIRSFSYRRPESFTNPTAIELHKVKLCLAGNYLDIK